MICEQKSKGNEGTSYAYIPGKDNKEQMLAYLPTTYIRDGESGRSEFRGRG